MSLISAIPETIQRGGQVRADGAIRLADIASMNIERTGNIRASEQRNNGQMIGAAIGDIGKLPQQYVQMKQEQARLDQNSQLQKLEIADKTKKAADQKALEDAMNGWTTNADGVVTPDRTPLNDGLKKAGKSYLIPKLNELLDAADESTLKVKESRQKLNDETNNTLGALGAAVHEAGNSIDDLQRAATHLVENGTLTAEQIKPYLEQAQKDPEGVAKITAGMMASSKTYKDYLVNSASKNALDEQRLASAAQRRDAEVRLEQDSNDKAAAKALGNASSQLGSATSKAEYARIYQGLPAELSAKFPDPESWSKDTAQRARFVGMSSKEQQDAIHAQHEESLAQGRLDAENTRIGKEGTSTDKGLNAAQKATAERWKAEELAKLEKAYRTPDPMTGAQMSTEQLEASKAQIQQSYLAQLGLDTKGAPKPAAAAPAAKPVAVPATVTSALADDKKYPRGRKYQGPGGVVYQKNTDGSITVAPK